MSAFWLGLWLALHLFAAVLAGLWIGTTLAKWITRRQTIRRRLDG